MIYLKQSTAATLKIGPFLDEEDGITPETALTITQAEVRLAKNGGDIAQKTEATSCTHDELGIYGCPIDVTDTNTLGRLQLFVTESGALPIWHDFMVITANVYDSMFSTDKLEVDLLQIAGVAQSATDLKDFADAGYDPATNKVEGVKLTDTTTTNTDMVGTNSAALATVCTEGRLAELDAANIPADVDLILADTGTDGVVVASGSKTGYALTDAGVDAILDEVVEGTTTLRQMLRILTAALAGKSAGGGSETITFRDIADAKNRISATVDENGNRTAITTDGA